MYFFRPLMDCNNVAFLIGIYLHSSDSECVGERISEREKENNKTEAEKSTT